MFKRNDNMKVSVLLSETFADTTISNVRETKCGSITWTTPLIDCNKATANGNVYGKDLVEAAIADEFVQSRMRNNAFIGELDHPTRENPERFMQVYLKNQSHRINKLWFEGDRLMGVLETTLGGYGDTLKKNIIQGIKPAVSLRATGNLVKTATNVNRSLRLFSWDAVFIPSNASSWGSNFGKASYANSPFAESIKHDAAGDMFFGECDFSHISGMFDVVEDCKTLLSEAMQNEFQPTKVVMKDKETLALISESTVAEMKVAKNVAAGLKDFFSSIR